ncbi:hypothetical protein V1460_20785 [Streptomyces sp. SCSIO 30461]|uniref:hypothetical protein n=1 Tax=Streptomyces sp. SCSIO 30461 TaxID=3118085 RepID=UPI0030CD68FD
MPHTDPRPANRDTEVTRPPPPETFKVDFITPRAGSGDPAWITIPLHRACGWSHDNDPLMPRVLLSSPDQKALHLFYPGYVDEIRYFCDCVLNGTSPELGSLEQAFHILQLFEAYRRAEPETWTTVKVEREAPACQGGPGLALAGRASRSRRPCAARTPLAPSRVREWSTRRTE